MTGTFLNNGSLHSDPADNEFTTLIIGKSGYLLGGAHDRFIITGDLISNSAKAYQWNTGDSELIFRDGRPHTLTLTGRDRGPNDRGFSNNFAWGTVRIGRGDSLILKCDKTGGRALYAKKLLLAGGVGQLRAITGNGCRIYYDAAMAENAYLLGRSYDLENGGRVTPVTKLP